jgi:hypothetical protein
MVPKTKDASLLNSAGTHYQQKTLRKKPQLKNLEKD